MNDDNDVPKPRPKYVVSPFMRKEIALFHRARAQMRMMRRYGDNDAPLPAVTPVRRVRPVRRIPGIGHIDTDC